MVFGGMRSCCVNTKGDASVTWASLAEPQVGQLVSAGYKQLPDTPQGGNRCLVV